MNAKELFPSQWLRAEDISGNQRVTIKGFRLERVADEDKPVIHFGQFQKGLVLNRTNTETLIKLLGETTENWIGRDVVLHVIHVQFRSEEVPAIRIKAAG